MKPPKRNPMIYGLATAATLIGGLVLGIAIGSTIVEALPGHMVGSEGLISAFALAGLVGSGLTWGWTMNRLAGTGEPRRAALAGVLGFSLPTFISMFTLFALEGAAENAIRSAGLQPPPIHRIFTVLFVPTAFILAACGAWALGRALREPRLARRLALSAGLAAAIGFLAVNLSMEALGWIVGSPGAAARNTMLTVLAVSAVGAALAGGTAVGVYLSRSAAQAKPVPAEAIPVQAGDPV
jgi:hypothetical protein